MNEAERVERIKGMAREERIEKFRALLEMRRYFEREAEKACNEMRIYGMAMPVEERLEAEKSREDHACKEMGVGDVSELPPAQPS